MSLDEDQEDSKLPSTNFDEPYFRQRQGNDPLRQKSFEQERAYLLRQLGREIFDEGMLLDVGCSTGEFIDAIGWKIGHAYGMEISDYARRIAENKGIKFERNLLNSDRFFDLIVFRGTIQYIPDPFFYIERAFRALKSGGHVIFFATPNTRSPYYLFFGTLPFLEENINYLIPCDTSLAMNLRNAGFEVLQLNFPYLGTPYARPVRDHLKFAKKLFFGTADRFPFWKSSMTVFARKP